MGADLWILCSYNLIILWMFKKSENLLPNPVQIDQENQDANATMY